MSGRHHYGENTMYILAHHEDMTAEEIAAEICLEVKSVRNRAKALGVKCKRPDRNKLQAVDKCYERFYDDPCGVCPRESECSVGCDTWRAWFGKTWHDLRVKYGKEAS